jgi:hypothetical protein
MKNTTHFKYIAWRDTEGLHEDTLNAISDLEFTKDELHFLQNLLAQHTLEIMHDTSSEKSLSIHTKLTRLKTTLSNLLNATIKHKNNLQVLIDDVEVPNELNDYKDAHYTIMMEVIQFHADLQKTKRSIFDLLQGIMKKSKQKFIKKE